MICKCKSVPLEAWSCPEGSRKLTFPDYVTTAQDGGKVISLKYRPPLPPGNTPGTHFCWRLSRTQGHSAIGRILYQQKILMTPAGIEPAAFRFVAQHLKHCATAVPHGKETEVKLHPKGRRGYVRKISPHTGIRSRGQRSFQKLVNFILITERWTEYLQIGVSRNFS